MEQKFSRRKWLKSIAPLAVAASGYNPLYAAAAFNDIRKLPAKDLFNVKGTFINAAYTHPMSLATAEAARAYTERRIINDRAADDLMGTKRKEAAGLFASMINATPDELAWVASTMAGEN